MKKNHHTRTPSIHTFFELHQHNVPQKIAVFMKIYHYDNENTVQSKQGKKAFGHSAARLLKVKFNRLKCCRILELLNFRILEP